MKTNQYFDGAVTSVEFFERDTRHSCGVVQPGNARSFQTEETEIITALRGDLVINGEPLVTDEPKRYEAGTVIYIEARNDTHGVYLCQYPEDVRGTK